ncbi:MAG: putative NEK/NEK2 protein kinase, partial [Streblomastix strix]
HRDLKPENILIDKDGNAKLADFGLAAKIEGKSYLKVAGTFYYTPPEAFTWDRMTVESDVWALGVILTELVTGVHPFAEKSQAESESKIKNGIFAPIPEYVPDELKKMIEKMLQVDPLKRPSVEELLETEVMKHQAQIERDKDEQKKEQSVTEILANAVREKNKEIEKQNEFEKRKAEEDAEKSRKILEDNLQLKQQLEQLNQQLIANSQVNERQQEFEPTKSVIIKKKILSFDENKVRNYQQIGEPINIGYQGTVYRISRKDNQLVNESKELSYIDNFSNYEKIKMLTFETFDPIYKEEQIKKQTLIHFHLHHENIIEFVEAFLHEDNFYIVMELAQGENLSDFYTKKKNGEFITEEEAWRILKGIASGIAYLHSKRILHKDLRPQNVLLTSDGTVKIFNFDISEELQPNQDFSYT